MLNNKKELTFVVTKQPSEDAMKFLANFVYRMCLEGKIKILQENKQEEKAS